MDASDDTVTGLGIRLNGTLDLGDVALSNHDAIDHEHRNRARVWAQAAFAITNQT